MAKNEPKWWQILLKEPANWLMILSLIGIILAFITGKILDFTGNN